MTDDALITRREVLEAVERVRSHQVGSNAPDEGPVTLQRCECECGAQLDRLVDCDRALRERVGTLRAKLRAWLDLASEDLGFPRGRVPRYELGSADGVSDLIEATEALLDETTIVDI